MFELSGPEVQKTVEGSRNLDSSVRNSKTNFIKSVSVAIPI